MNKKIIGTVLILLLGLFLFNACTLSTTQSTTNQQSSGKVNPTSNQNQQKTTEDAIPNPPAFPE